QFARLDGQLLLPVSGEDIAPDEAFASAERSESAGDLAAAQRWYELAARLDRTDAVIPFNLANVLDARGRSREAEMAYRQAIGRNPHFADAWFNLGVLQERGGRKEEALSSYREAFRLEPGYGDAIHNAAALLMDMRRFDEALPLWERIAAASPEGAREAKRLAHLCRLQIRAASVRR
ncbi:MAG: tetratricopeptide repeat protein, partial [Methylobacteriaceae bacterium]|nr:tetratricopeptide repeat protein [Methylobacteriaceae bacterium]